MALDCELETDDLYSAWFVVVVCGPAAAVEGAEERAHFGCERGRVVVVVEGHLPFDGGAEGSWGERAGLLMRSAKTQCSSFFLSAPLASRAVV